MQVTEQKRDQEKEHNKTKNRSPDEKQMNGFFISFQDSIAPMREVFITRIAAILLVLDAV